MSCRKVIWKRTAVIFTVCMMLFITSFAAPLTCQAAVTQDLHSVTLRVAFYPTKGFFAYDEHGHKTGYGVELLNKISQYTGIQFVYVPVQNQKSIREMLLDGEVDLQMPAPSPSQTEPSDLLSCSATSILDTYYVLLAPKDRDDLYYQDYDTIRTLRIAIADELYQDTAVKEYLKQIGVIEKQLILCRDDQMCREKLAAGEADALLSDITDMDGSMKLLARFGNIANYLSMTANHPMLDVLDASIAQIKLDEPLFLPKLYADWFPDRTMIPLTREESEYLASVDTLTFAFRTNEGYLSRCEDGEYYGIYEEQAKAVCERLGVQYRAVSIDDCLSGKLSADVYCGFFFDENFAAERNYNISAPINDINYYLIQRKGEQIDAKTCKIASVEKFHYTEDYLQKKYRAEQFVYFDTYEQCMRAVVNKEADIAVINNYIAEYYLEMFQFSDLSARLINEYSHLYCFATDEDNEFLASILTKTLSSFSDDEMQQFYIKGMEREPEMHYLLAFMYQDPLLFTLMAGGLSALIIAMILLIIYFKKSETQNKTLEKALSAKSDFLARMSHDMRTPLNAVLGFAKLAQTERADSASIQDNITKIQSSGEYLLGLINDVLDAAMIESGKVELHYETVDGPEFLKSIVDEFKALGALMGITLHADIEKADTPYVKMDKLRTRQIYSNLLSNAFKFSQPGQTVEWNMADTIIDGTHMEFVTSISDHGCGMSETFMKHMFEPFVQENVSGMFPREGTGLGLTIVKKFVELADGTISVESEPNVGTTVTLHMKRELPTKEEVEELKQQKSLSTHYPEVLRGKKVLLCEDHPINREITVRQLKEAGIDTDCAEDGRKGVDMLNSTPEGYYDAVLMDIRMPVLNGIEATKVIRLLQRRDVKEIPIIAVTANAYSEDVTSALEAGMNAHIAKPVDLNQLCETLARLIAERKERGKVQDDKMQE